jgi:RNA polymerase sigma factor (sigma-70 family)
MHIDSSNNSHHRIENLEIVNLKFSISDLPDDEIWEEFKRGNEGAFNHIYKTYFQDLYSYGQQFSKDLYLLRDLIQDLFIDIRKNRRNLGSTSSIKFYLFKAFRRKICRHLKRNKIVYTENIESFCNLQFENLQEVRILQIQLDDQKKKVLERAFVKLSKRQKEAVYHYFYQSMSYKEVASIMSLNNVKSARNLIYKSINALKAQLYPIKNKLLALFFTL